ncbi:YeiH family protein [Phenylobacterium sp.]|uniref:YeiH family protein n=1 Tax=Phenylobacterium sp. TaxID=1871053 RepID=UPI002FCBF292
MQAATPGILLCVALAAVADWLGAATGLPGMLLALAMGFLASAVADRPALAPGIALAAKTLLRLGVACLGAKLTWAQLDQLGPGVGLLVILAVAATIVLGAAVGRSLKLGWGFSVLCAGAVAICGASAALAIAAALPEREDVRRGLPLVVAGVTVLSTLAMLAYPLLAVLLNYTPQQTAVFLGATIHDVAQVAGAGFAVSDPVGQSAVAVKLARVACLLPAVYLIGLLFRDDRTSSRAAALPWFLIAFAALAAARSVGWIGDAAGEAIGGAGRTLLLVAIVALGLRTRPRDLLSAGWRPLSLLIVTSGLLAGGVAAALSLGIP